MHFKYNNSNLVITIDQFKHSVMYTHAGTIYMLIVIKMIIQLVSTILLLVLVISVRLHLFSPGCGKVL